MAKSKRKQKDDLVNVIGGAIIILCFYIYLKTNSISFAITVFLLLFVLIMAVAFLRTYLYKEKMRKSGILEIDKMTGIQFENYLGELFKSQGYKVTVTPPSGDYGADLLITKDNIKTVVQAKCYKSNVGIKAVQEINSAKSHYKAQNAWVVTNSYYTKAAQNLAKTNNVVLINRDKLIEWSTDFRKNK